MSEETKICYTCEKELPHSAFGTKGRSIWTGETRVDGNCRKCRSVYTAKWNRERRRRDPAFNVLRNCRQADYAKSRENDLDLQFIAVEIAKPCAYCGTTSRFRALDRKDSNIGHTKANSVSCCVRCNLIKRDMPQKAWIIVAAGVRAAEELGLFGEWSPGNFLKNTPGAKNLAVFRAAEAAREQ